MRVSFCPLIVSDEDADVCVIFGSLPQLRAGVAQNADFGKSDRKA